jgi:2,4-dienoyl-CoA reductase-like NADH-dependent reductase (Old Yellow Enzyme family)
MRFPLEVVDAVRAAWPADRPLFFRASTVEGEGGDWVLEHTLELARALKAHGVDVVDCSSGGIMGDGELPAIPRVPGYHVGYSGVIRRKCDVPTMVVGLITDAGQAEQILRQGHADLIALSRELMYNPNWPAHAAAALGYADPMALLPPPEAYRLRGRQKQLKEIAPGSEITIPFGHGRNVPYSWSAGCAYPQDD